MLFNTSNFFIFLAAVLLLFYVTPRGFRKYVLLIASYYFYGSWNYRFIPLLLSLTAFDYEAGIWLGSNTSRLMRRIILIFSISINLAFLGYFKYYNFLAVSLAGLAGHPPGQYLREIVLPLGISFHTFQSMSYVIDVYRGEQEPIRDPVGYGLFIYLSESITDFWHRWHISLSTWLRDYLYIPLGGSRRGPWRTYANLMLTMLLGGLWHGASWTF
jgi:alginate O-acetyltransferase complex protein AlgI